MSIVLTVYSRLGCELGLVRLQNSSLISLSSLNKGKYLIRSAIYVYENYKLGLETEKKFFKRKSFGSSLPLVVRWGGTMDDWLMVIDPLDKFLVPHFSIFCCKRRVNPFGLCRMFKSHSASNGLANYSLSCTLKWLRITLVLPQHRCHCLPFPFLNKTFLGTSLLKLKQTQWLHFIRFTNNLYQQNLLHR